MTPERWQRIKDLFHAAADRQPHERAAFLDQACGTDREVRVYIESLFAHDHRAHGELSSEAEIVELLANERARVMEVVLARQHGPQPGDLVGRVMFPFSADLTITPLAHRS